MSPCANPGLLVAVAAVVPVEVDVGDGEEHHDDGRQAQTLLHHGAARGRSVGGVGNFNESLQHQHRNISTSKCLNI